MNGSIHQTNPGRVAVSEAARAFVQVLEEAGYVLSGPAEVRVPADWMATLYELSERASPDESLMQKANTLEAIRAHLDTQSKDGLA